MINRIISVLFLSFIGVTCALMYPIALLIFLMTYPFDRRRVILHQFSSFWASMYLWVMPAWSMTVKGRENIRKGATYIVVSNHQSQLDILIAFRLFFPFKWVSKAEVFKVPFIGWNMVLNDYVRLFRGDGESVRLMLQHCEKHLKKGSSVYFFPEGTRSVTGRLKEFKPGAFVLAHKMKVPVLTIAINGTKNALPKNSVNFHGKHHLRIEVLGEIPYDAFRNLSVEETAAMVRETIAAHIDEHRVEAETFESRLN